MRNPNGYGSVTKLKGKRRRPYMVRISGSEGREILGYYATKKDALQALAEFNKSPYDISGSSTFAEVFEKWYHEKERTVGVQALCSYQAAFRHCELIHDRPLASLRLVDYQAVADGVSETSKSTATNVKLVLSGVNDYAMRYDLIPRDYSQYVMITYAPPKDKHKPFTAEEIAAVWKMKDCPERDITLILLYSGWRISELLELPTENIDLEMMTMVGGKKTAAGKNRLVPIHHRILPMMCRYAALDRRMSYTKYQKWLMEHTGHLCHDTRHTFISLLQSAGADRICIERIVGHTSKSLTDKVYTHKDIAELRKTIELLR